MISRETTNGFNEDIRAGFITVVRVRRDGVRLVRWLPEADEWWVATAEYCTARNDGTAAEAHRKRVREAWLAIKDRVELSCAEQQLVDEVMRFSTRTAAHARPNAVRRMAR